MAVGNTKLKDAVEQTWIKLNSVPNLKLRINITAAALAEGTQGTCTGGLDRHTYALLSSPFLAKNLLILFH